VPEDALITVSGHSGRIEHDFTELWESTDRPSAGSARKFARQHHGYEGGAVLVVTLRPPGGVERTATLRVRRPVDILARSTYARTPLAATFRELAPALAMVRGPGTGLEGLSIVLGKGSDRVLPGAGPRTRLAAVRATRPGKPRVVLGLVETAIDKYAGTVGATAAPSWSPGEPLCAATFLRTPAPVDPPGVSRPEEGALGSPRGPDPEGLVSQPAVSRPEDGGSEPPSGPAGDPGGATPSGTATAIEEFVGTASTAPQAKSPSVTTPPRHVPTPRGLEVAGVSAGGDDESGRWPLVLAAALGALALLTWGTLSRRRRGMR
jgi:hypothetical protein